MGGSGLKAIAHRYIPARPCRPVASFAGKGVKALTAIAMLERELGEVEYLLWQGANGPESTDLATRKAGLLALLAAEHKKRSLR